MALHLFDTEPKDPRSLSELLEGFWDSKPPANPAEEKGKVWVFTTVYLSEKGDDAFYCEFYKSKEAALWAIWLDLLDEMFDMEKEEGNEGEPLIWLAETLVQLQDLRDEGFFQEYDQFYRLEEKEVN